MKNIASAYLSMSSSTVELPKKNPEKSVISEVLSAIDLVDKRDVPVKVSNEQLQKEIASLKKYVDSKNTVPQVSSTAGSGEVRVLRMDDVDKSNLADGSMMIYDALSKMLRFIPVPSSSVSESNIVRSTRLVTSNYTITSSDYYIGVNATTLVSITLPPDSDGRQVIIKDESGKASIVPIIILGTIDNDPGGVILQTNNGCITLINRSGWRII